MKAGFAQVDFTPLYGFMPGEFQGYFAQGAHLPLCANAGAFGEGEDTVILISADYMQFPTHYADTIRKMTSEATGVLVDHITLAATHTHMSCSSPDDCWKCPGEPEIAAVVAKRIAQSAVEALADRREATLSAGITEERRFSFCRDWVLKDGTVKCNPGYTRDDLDHTCATPDYRVNVMKVEREGKLSAIMVNYANHPDTHWGKDRMKFSPEWPGFMRKALQEKYGEDVKVLFFNGACGDVNDRDFGFKTDINGGHRDPSANPPEVIGNGLADTVSKLLDTLPAGTADGEVKAFARGITVNRRQISDRERKWAEDTLKRAENEYLKSWEYGTAKAFMERSRNVPETEEFVVQVVKVGPWVIAAMPGEIYTELGLLVKEGSPFEHTVISELTNGSHGYVIPDRVRENGSYEGRFSSGTTGFGACDAIVKGTLEMLKELK